MSAFDYLADPIRRRILELLADQELPAGAISQRIHAEAGISQPAVSQHLRTLREGGLVTVRASGRQRWYAVNAAALQPLDVWLQQFRPQWESRLDALATELARGRRQQREAAAQADAADQARKEAS